MKSKRKELHSEYENFETSFVIRVKHQVFTESIELFREVNLYPNPANEAVNIAFSLSHVVSFTLMITDIQGGIIQTQSMTRTEGNQLIKIPIADLGLGTYLVHMISPDGKLINDLSSLDKNHLAF